MSHSQLELFSQGNGLSQSKINTSDYFLRYLRKYEKAMLILIGFVISGTIAFSLGVERGKKVVMAPQALPAQDQPRIIAPQNNLPAQIIKPPTPPVKEQTEQNYTIQVASYQTKTLAQKEVERLKRKGLSSLTLPKGKYIIVCVGNFADKENGKIMLIELKKQYRDCFIRRL